MEIRHPEVGVCGLSCRLCPHYHAAGESRCSGCKGAMRMAVGCPFITCAVKRKGIEFCWECEDSGSCERWAGHRGYGRERDTFVCYAALEDNIAAVRRNGIDEFADEQRVREALLREMLEEFNEGRSKTYYSIAVTVLDPGDVRSALDATRRETTGEADVRMRSKSLHAYLDAVASVRVLRLALRK
jgi:hypothetical protein